MNWGKLHLIDWDRDSFKALVGRKMGERRRDKRRLAEQRTTKHQFQARKSCVADAREVIALHGDRRCSPQRDLGEKRLQSLTSCRDSRLR